MWRKKEASSGTLFKDSPPPSYSYISSPPPPEVLPLPPMDEGLQLEPPALGAGGGGSLDSTPGTALHELHPFARLAAMLVFVELEANLPGKFR